MTPDPTGQPEPLDEILADCLQAEERGEYVDVERLMERYPQFAEPLREFFQYRSHVEQIAQPLREIAPPQIDVGRVHYFGDYELLEELGRGGMGIVYRARQTSLDRPVAVKMLLSGQFATADAVQRFETEAAAAAQLDHPSIVTIFECGVCQGQHFYSMAVVDGSDLNATLADGPRPPRDAAQIALDLAEALDYAHARGVIHRDLKPANVLLDRQGRVQIADFGLARRLTEDSQLTHTGHVLGTPSYMSPEQSRPGRFEIGPATDIYSLGAILYALLSGHAPFQGASPLETMQQVVDDEPVPLRRLVRSVPADLQTICHKCLAKEPSGRYATAAELADDLRRFLDGRPIVARPVGALGRCVKWARRRPAPAALALVVVLSALAGLAGIVWHNGRLQREVTRADDNLADANEQRGRAVSNYRKARETLGRILARLDDRRLMQVPKLRELQREMLEDSLSFYRYALSQLEADDREVQFDAAKAFRQAGNVQFQLGREQDAMVNYEQARRLLEELLQAEPDNVEYAKHLSGHYNNLGLLHGTDVQALECLKRSIEIRSRHEETSPEWSAALGESHHNLGAYHQRKGDLQSAKTAYQKAVAFRRRADQRAPSLSNSTSMASSVAALALVHHQLQELPQAARQFAAADKLLREAREAGHPPDHLALPEASNRLNWGNLLASSQPQVAMKHYSRGVELLEDVHAREPSLTEVRANLASCLGARCNLHRSLQQFDAAKADMSRAIEVATEAQQRTLRAFYVDWLARNGDHQLAVQQAKELAARKDLASGDLYNLACAYGVCSGALAEAARSDDTTRQLVDSYQQEAIKLLARAKEAGLLEGVLTIAKIHQDADLKPLADRPDFQRLFPVAEQPNR